MAIITSLDGGEWEKYEYPERIAGNGILCQRCGLFFSDKSEIEVLYYPHYELRHMNCNSERHINILGYAIIEISKLSDSKTWYHNLRGARIGAFIRSDIVAEFASLAELATLTGNPDLMQSRIRYGIYKNDYKIINFIVAMKDVMGKDKIDVVKAI
jgi:hypothetical protein